MRSPRFHGGDSVDRAMHLGTRSPEHRVQFYDSDEFLAVAMADFLAPAIKAGDPVVVIATEPHRRSFANQLKSRGFDVDRVSGTGQLSFADAREMLETFMVGTAPDLARFRSIVGDVLRGAPSHSGPGGVRIYGEMVDLLWRDGNMEAALQLEQVGNELIRTYECSILCSYAMGHFYRSENAAQFEAICGEHTHVAPTEHYMAADTATRLHEITILEQRSRALDAEIAHRKELEGRLREALDDRHRTEEALRLRERELSSLREEHQRLLGGQGRPSK